MGRAPKPDQRYKDSVPLLEDEAVPGAVQSCWDDFAGILLSAPPLEFLAGHGIKITTAIRMGGRNNMA